MRHLVTLLAAIIIAPLAWILIALGQDRSVAAFAASSGGTLHGGDFARPLQVLAAAGLLLGIIGTLRFSPLGAFVSGVGYVSSYALLLVAPNQVVQLFSHTISVAGHRADLATPMRNGTVLFAGALLVVGAASVGRWRRGSRPADEAAGTVVPHDRPLGADGLGLLSPNHGIEPEFAARYGTGPGPAAGGSPRLRPTTFTPSQSSSTPW
jgi:hypothetical protein